ncbi:MAG: dynamin family protein [Desulfobacteraceae bacterium]|nr:dynamin family protein [Desulfobacteraceae bacterium]
MSAYSQYKDKIRYRAEILEETIDELKNPVLAGEPAASMWRGYLGGVLDSLKDPLLRIAVVGPVKSGKSTLINAMLGEDLLKRGAGIVTSFITRVVTGDRVSGWVELKSWRQINAEVNASLRMLPVFSEREGPEEDLDLRNPEDRNRIVFWLDKMKSGWLHTRGSIDPNFLFLERCLDGYELVEVDLGPEPCRVAFDRSNIGSHQYYAGDESRSVYVRDIEIAYPSSWLGDRIELADCQGSDSPNLAHFEMLQHYLLGSHFIVYVISSRSGLREADFKLLDLIKSLKMFPQTLFVLNLDFDIHNDRDDVERIVERVRSELGWIVPDPPLSAHSALFQLLKQTPDKSPKADRRHFKVWKESKGLAKSTESGWSDFRRDLSDRICNRRAEILLGCGLSRLGMIASNVLDTVCARQSALSMDMSAMTERAVKLRSRHLALQSTLQNLADTVSGLNQSVKGELDARVAGWLDPTKGTIIREALDLTEQFPAGSSGSGGFSDFGRLIRDYYGYYLEFRRNLSRHLVEKVNLRILQFSMEQESFLKDRLRKASEELWAFFDTALADYRREIPGVPPEKDAEQPRPEFDPFRPGEIVPPCFSAFLQRNSLGRSILFLKFGITSFPNILSGLRALVYRKNDAACGENFFGRAWELARDETKNELLRAFSDFREKLVVQFLHRLVDEGCIGLLEEFRARAEMAQVNFAGMLELNSLEGEERRAAAETLARSRQIAEAMIEDIEAIRREIRNGCEAPRVEDGPAGKERGK